MTLILTPTEVTIVLVLFTLIMIVIIWLLLGKPVIVPNVSVATDKSSYFREESVQIAGTLVSNGSPLVGQTVGISIQPPSGDTYSLPQVTTDAEGAYVSSWEIPSDAVEGSYGLIVASLGVIGTTTFTPRNQVMR